MTLSALRSEERIGLAVALAAHAGLAALLLGHTGPAPAPMPERMTVTLSDTVGLTDTSPEPAAAPAADLAPTPGETPQPPPEPAMPPAPALAAPRAPLPAAEPSPQRHRANRLITERSGAGRIGDDFLAGVGGAEARAASRNLPAAEIGPAVQASLASAISRQLKPNWAAPQGAEAERLVTVLAWSLNRDGSLAGEPSVVRQDGITEANRAQAARHAEQAIRAVRLAAPFDLPGEYYPAWQRVGAFRFDRRLSQ